MNSGLIYYFKTSTKNRIKNFKRKPLKSMGMLIMGIYFIFLPMVFKTMIEVVNLDNPTGYIAFIAIISIYLGMPSTLSYFKRKGLVFKECDVNFTFTSPISPKQNIIFAMSKNILIMLIQYGAFFVGAFYIFKIPLFKSIFICLIGFVFSNIINISLAIIMYGSENISKRVKDVIKYLVFGILIALSTMLIIKFVNSGFNIKSISNFLTGNLIMLVPIFGWEVGFLKLVLEGPTLYNVLATVLYFSFSIILFIYVKRLKIQGEYYEEAMSYSEEYTKVLNKANKEGTIGWVGKKDKIKTIEFSQKGSYSKAIFYKQLDEMRKVSFIKKYGKILLYLLVSILGGFLMDANEISSLNEIEILGIAYGVSIYTGTFFNKNQNWNKEYKNFYIYLFPDKLQNKMFYSTLLKNIKSAVEGFVLAFPVVVMVGLPIYLGVLSGIIYFSVQVMVLYIDYILREVLGPKIGDSMAYMVMLGIDFLILLLGGVIAFLLYILTNAVWLSFGFIIVFLLGIACLGLFLGSKLYVNMEFVNE